MACRELVLSLFVLGAVFAPSFLYSDTLHNSGLDYAFARPSARRAVLSVKVRGLTPTDKVYVRQGEVETPIPLGPVDPLTGLAVGSEARLVAQGQFCIVQVRVERQDPREQSGLKYPPIILAGLDHAWVGYDQVVPFDITVHPVGE